MRERRIDSKLRVAIRRFLEDGTGASEVSFAIYSYMQQHRSKVSEEDFRYIEEVVDTYHRPLSELRDILHPIYQKDRLERLERLEKEISADVKTISEKILIFAAKRKTDEA